MKSVFISYSHKNLNFAERLVHDLHDAGLDVWLDIRILGGEVWLEEIIKAINRAEIVIICLSPDAVESEWVRREIIMARAQRKLLIPVMIEACFDVMKQYDDTEFLLDLQVIDFSRGYEQAFPLLLQSLPGVTIAPPADLDPATIPNPFKGLEPFQETDAAYFFGREDLTEKLLDHLRPNARFLSVVGASGSGKSSLVRAGLIPAIRQGILPCSTEWPIVTFSPGTSPTEALAKRLLPFIKGTDMLPQVIRELKSGPETLHQLVAGILGDVDSEIRFVLVIDQFEEVFTQASQAEAAEFLDLLHYAVTVTGGQTLAILTMRADFFDRLSAYPSLAALFERDNMVIVTDMKLDELRLSIQGPATAVGLVYEPGLVQQVLDDVRQQPGSLPLLEYALKELYEQRDGQKLTWAAYEAVGGVRHALARHAEQIFSQQTPAQQTLMQRILLHLIEINEAGRVTRRRVPRTDLVFQGVSDQAVQDVLYLLTSSKSRLLTVSRDIILAEGEKSLPPEYIEISHEALIREWDRFTTWVEENQEELRIGSEVLKSAHEWERAGHDMSYLLTGRRLQRAEAWLDEADANNLQRAFIHASRRAAQRKQRVLGSTFAGAFVLVSALSILLFWQYQQAEEQRTEAEDQAATAVSAQATSEHYLRQTWGEDAQRMALLSRQAVDEGNPRDALLLALEGLVHYPDGIYHAENYRALLNAMQMPGLERLYLQHMDRVEGSAWDQAGTRLLTWSYDDTARVWDATTGNELLVLHHENWVEGALWSDDETHILTWDWNGTVHVWEVATGNETLTLPYSSKVRGALWNQEETQILVWSDDNKVRIWDATTGEVLLIFPHPARVEGATWNKDETRVLTWAQDGGVRLWDRTGGEIVWQVHHDDDVLGAAWNHDGSRLLTWSRDGTARIWEVGDSEARSVLRHEDVVQGAAWNHDETRILTWSRDGTARIWDSEDGTELLTLQQGIWINGATWNQDESRVLTWGCDGTARVWDTSNGDKLLTLKHGNQVVSAAWNADETLILTRANTYQIIVWNAKQGDEVFSVSYDKAIAGATWHGDALLTWSWDGTVRLWDTGSHAELFNVAYPESIRGAVWNQDRTRILAWYRDGLIRLLDARRGQVLSELRPPGPLQGVAWSPDESRILTWSQDNAARAWDVQSGDELLLLAHDGIVNGAAWSQDEKRILTWSQDGKARVWDADTGQTIFTVDCGANVLRAAWNVDETRILSLAADGTFWMWQAELGYVLRYKTGVANIFWNEDRSYYMLQMTDNSAEVWDAVSGLRVFDVPISNTIQGAAWVPDGTYLAVWAADYTVRIWETATGTELFVLPYTTTITRATWDAGGTRLAVRLDDGTVQVWDSTTQAQTAISPHSAPLTDLVWSEDGLYVLAWTETGTVQMWDAINAESVFSLEHGNPVSGAIWSDDGTRLLVWSEDGSICAYLIDLEQLLQLAQSYHVRPLSNEEREIFFLPALEPTPPPE